MTNTMLLSKVKINHGLSRPLLKVTVGLLMLATGLLMLGA